MAARTTITLPNTLVERMEGVKHRMNISSLCAQALEVAVTEIEEEESRLKQLKQEVSGMTALIERMTNEKEVALTRYVQRGQEWATHFADKFMSYDDLVEWGAEAHERVNVSRGEQHEFPEGLLDEMRGNSRDGVNDIPRNHDEWDAFADGFFTALSSLYEMIDTRISIAR